MDDALNLLNTTFYELSITYFKIRYTVSLDYIMTLKSSSRSRLSPSRDIEEALNHVGINRIMRQNVALMFKMLSNIIQIFVDNFSFLLQSLGYTKLLKCFKNISHKTTQMFQKLQKFKFHQKIQWQRLNDLR